MSNSKIKVGVIGFGNSAKAFHLPFITTQADYQLVAISSSKQDEVQAAFAGVTCYANAEDLIFDPNIELVIITAPNHVHFSLTKLALEHNKHVVLEKPMANTSDEAQQLVDIANQHNKLLTIYQNRRWDGDFLTVKKLLADKKLGDLTYFESHFDRFRPVVETRWREERGLGNGIWFDLGPHLVDQALHLFGLPTAVTGRILEMRENAKTADFAHVILHYPNLEVVLHASALSAAPNQRFRLDGSKASYIKYGLDVQENQLKAGMSPLDEAYAKEAQGDFGSLFSADAQKSVVTLDGQYPTFYHLMAGAIKGQGEVPVNPQDIVNVIKIIELANQSHQQAKTLNFGD
ncbi:oxidoreductase [Catenovulum sp. 2E275]|uniref:oxidoreductase n=1 Tax=Catenovulum sp. 2E275 TaxID=2980497 RepID=UPI0021D3E514|nr:oxidoreductase [Catenovulum sp. 2E275]MCU4674644.1 oxidoreductase [Catenovulum sp. 2E275]